MKNLLVKDVTFYLICIVSSIFCFVIVTGENDESVLNGNWSYCFEFTWFGPDYDNFTRYNGTCADYLDDSRDDHIPCSPPVVITEDGTPPNIDYLWTHHKTSVLCRRSTNNVCAKYTYLYNGEIENATYMCTKVQAIGEGVITSGCYTQEVDGYEVELCVCESNPGIKYKPCNSAPSLSINLLFIPLFLFYLLIFKLF